MGPGIDSEESIQPGWKSIPGLLKRLTNTGSVQYFACGQVYDYDWGMRDDFIGEASVDLRKLPLNLAQDLLLSLCDSGQRLLQN
jgi:hypothetical protein